MVDNPIAIIRSKDLTVDRLGDNECNGWQRLVVPVVDSSVKSVTFSNRFIMNLIASGEDAFPL